MKKLPHFITVLLMILFVALACTKHQTGPDSLSGVTDCSCSAGSLFNSCSIECESSDGSCFANCTTVWSFGIPFARCNCNKPAGSKFTATDAIAFNDFNIRNLQFTKKLIGDYNEAHFREMESAITNVLAVAKSSDGRLKADKFNRFFAAWEALTAEERNLILPALKSLMNQPETDQTDQTSSIKN